MTQVQLHTAGIADIPSAAFIFDEGLACQLEIKDLFDTGVLLPQRMIELAYVKLLLRTSNVRAALMILLLNVARYTG